MFDAKLRGIKDFLLKPLVGLLARYSLTPMQLTGAGFLFGIFAAAAAGMQWWTVALVLWLVNRIFDGLDGALAREMDLSSDLGGYLDLLADFIIYALLPLGIASGLAQSADAFPQLLFQSWIWPAAAFLLAACYVNSASWMYLSALMEKKWERRDDGRGTDPKTSIIMPKGIIEGSETILFYSLTLLLPGYATPLFILFAFLVSLTALLRIFWWVRL
jgi:phosphatidylglycerophosphate synthase